MPSHSALPRTAAVFAESTFAETQSDWGSNGNLIYVIEPDVTGVTQALVENQNIRPRQIAHHRLIKGLRSESTFTCSLYLTAKGTNAAEGAAATGTAVHTVLKAAFGGLDLGYAAGLAGGTAAEPTVETGEGANYEAGDFVWAYDATTGLVELARIESVSTDTLTMLWDLSFTPDGGGADVLHAAIDVYPNEDAIENHADANHVTLGWKVQGRNSEDVYELRGCKPTAGALAATAGEPVALEVAHQVATYAITPTATAFAGTPVGEAPHVPGIGSTCSVKLADFGSAPGSDKATRGTVTITWNLEYAVDQGVGGTEGVNGYSGTIGAATIELMLPYDDAYEDEFEAGTVKHLVMQIGNTPTKAWGLYAPRCEYAERPTRVDEGGLATSRVVLRCLEDTASVSGLSGDDIDKRRAPYHLLFCA